MQLINFDLVLVESYTTEIVLLFGAITCTSHSGDISLALFPSVAIY